MYKFLNLGSKEKCNFYHCEQNVKKNGKLKKQTNLAE